MNNEMIERRLSSRVAWCIGELASPPLNWSLGFSTTSKVGTTRLASAHSPCLSKYLLKPGNRISTPAGAESFELPPPGT